MRGLVRDAARAVAEQRQIVIFPEGTRAAPGTLLPLQPGVAALASATGLPVIPVATELGAILGAAGVPQTPGGDPHRAAAADPGGDCGGRNCCGGWRRRCEPTWQGRAGLWTSLWADSVPGSGSVAEHCAN